MPNSVNALLQGKCPRCRQGTVFTFPLSNVTRFSAMNLKCPHCGVGFEPEPGFYFGAMFVSYAINVALFVATWLMLYVFMDPPDWVYISSIVAVAILLMPLTYRYSRLLWLYWFGGHSYNPTL